MHINTHIVAEERNKNNTNGKITMMIDKREREKKMHLHIHLFKESRRWCCITNKNGLIILVEIGVFVLKRKKGQWAGTSNYNKAPWVSKDEKKLKLCWEMGCQLC